ncbi:hypothetical protein [Bacillus velezensis]|uniref:hypothetical protein n=1 Tax=Bacillus velezensis TaxID=492670 RepID=UPI002FBE2281
MAGLRAGFYFAAVLWLAAVILAHMWGADAKTRRKKSGKMRQSITRHDFIFVYAFKKEEILFG